MVYAKQKLAGAQMYLFPTMIGRGILVGLMMKNLKDFNGAI